MTFAEILAGLQRLQQGTPYQGDINLGEPPQFDPSTVGGERQQQQLTSEANIPPGLAAAEQDIQYPAIPTPAPAPLPLLDAQGTGQPDLTLAPPADANATLRDLGVSVGGGPTGRTDQFATGPAGTTFVGNPAGLRGGFAEAGSRFGGTLNPGDITAAEARGAAADATAGRQENAEARLRDLLAQKRQFVNNPEALAGLDRQIAVTAQELGLAGTEGLTGAGRAAKLAEAQRATTEAQTAPGAREKFGEEAALAREKIVGAVAASRVQGLAAQQVAANLGLDVAHIQGLNARQLEAMKEGAARAEKAFDRETKRGEISGNFLATLGPSFNAIQVEKDPVKKSERMGYWLQSIKSMQDLLISGRGGAAARPAGTPAPPELRKRAEEAARAAGRPPLKPGDQFRSGGKVYVY